MAEDNQPLRIIGNESNNIIEMEPGSKARTQEAGGDKSNDNASEQVTAKQSEDTLPPGFNDLATNDGSVLETLDTAFHGKPGVAEGDNPSGSDRADYYEARSQGESDAEEEAGA